MTSKIANVRLSEEEFAFIDRLVEDGYFSSRSDFIQTSVKNLIHDISKRKIYEYKKRRKEPNLTHQELLDSIKKTRKEVYQEIWEE
ncbi:MAG: ribbon-helix-helix domain-containing protein [Candidatus Methanofastidiosia archaeon]